MSGYPRWRKGALLYPGIPSNIHSQIHRSQASGRGGLGNIAEAPATTDNLEFESQYRPSLDSANGIPLAVIHSRLSGRGGAGNGANEGLSVADLERLEREEIAKVKRASTASTSACVSVSFPPSPSPPPYSLLSFFAFFFSSSIHWLPIFLFFIIYPFTLHSF